jgi:hypothetical protein
MVTGISCVPLASCEVLLVWCEDVQDKSKMAYPSTATRDIEGNKVFGSGEDLVRGHNISVG